MNYKKFFKVSIEYLIENKPDSLTPNDLYQYLEGSNHENYTLNDVVKRLCITGQNYQGFKNYIGYFTRNEYNIKKAMFDFDLHQCLEYYHSFEDLYQGFINSGCSMRKSQKSWLLYSRRIYNGLQFLKDFESFEEFQELINNYDGNEIECVHSIATTHNKFFPFTLTCDFLKELGFKKYSKPDVYILKVMNFLEYIEHDYFEVMPVHSEYTAFLKMKQIAEENDISDYFLDKLIWTICSGEIEGTYYKKMNIEKEYFDLLKEKL